MTETANSDFSCRPISCIVQYITGTNGGIHDRIVCYTNFKTVDRLNLL